MLFFPGGCLAPLHFNTFCSIGMAKQNEKCMNQGWKPWQRKPGNIIPQDRKRILAQSSCAIAYGVNQLFSSNTTYSQDVIGPCRNKVSHIPTAWPRAPQAMHYDKMLHFAGAISPRCLLPVANAPWEHNRFPLGLVAGQPIVQWFPGARRLTWVGLRPKFCLACWASLHGRLSSAGSEYDFEVSTKFLEVD